MWGKEKIKNGKAGAAQPRSRAASRRRLPPSICGAEASLVGNTWGFAGAVRLLAAEGLPSHRDQMSFLLGISPGKKFLQGLWEAEGKAVPMCLQWFSRARRSWAFTGQPPMSRLSPVSSMERGAGAQERIHMPLRCLWHGAPGVTHQIGSLSHKLLGRLFPDGRHCDHPPDGIVLWQRWALVLEFLKEERHRSSPRPTTTTRVLLGKTFRKFLEKAEDQHLWLYSAWEVLELYSTLWLYGTSRARWRSMQKVPFV